MGVIGDLSRAIGLGPKETVTPEQRLNALKSEAEAAEKRADQTKQAVEYRKRILTAERERIEALRSVGATGKKSGLSRNQLLVGAVIAIILIIVVAKAC